MPRVVKQEVVRQMIVSLEGNIAETETAAEGARQRAIDAEGRMQSRYDTHKEELGSLASSLSERLVGQKQMLQSLRSIRCQDLSNAPIQNGSVIYLRSEKKGEMTFFIVIGGSGFFAESNGVKVLCLAPNAPILQKMLGKRAGDRISEFNPVYGSVEILQTE